MAEHGKFCSIAETKLLLDMWSQDHIQKQLKAAARMLCLERSPRFWKSGSFIQQCRAKTKGGLIQCSPSSGTSVSLQPKPN